MIKRLLCCVLISALVLLSSCRTPTPVAFQPADELQPAVESAGTGFALDLFRRVAAGSERENVLISPASVWLALGMLCNGASGDTAKGMAQALHATGISLSDLNRDNAGLMGVLSAADPKVQVAIANSAWLGKAYEKDISSAFLQVARQEYGAEVNTFSSTNAAEKINQ